MGCTVPAQMSPYSEGLGAILPFVFQSFEVKKWDQAGTEMEQN